MLGGPMNCRASADHVMYLMTVTNSVTVMPSVFFRISVMLLWFLNTYDYEFVA